MTEPIKNFRAGYRWIVLLLFALVAGITQMLWINFAPLITMLQNIYGVDELVASLPTMVFPLIYVILSVPAGMLIDRKGYKFTIGLGCVIMAVSSCVRIYDASFWALLGGQVGCAVAQPLVINGISKLVSDWFDQEQGALAIGLGTVGIFLGMAVGMAVSPVLAEDMGIQGAMMVFAVITVVCSVAFLVFAKENGPKVDDGSTMGTFADLKSLMRSKDLILVFAIAFLAIGVFNGLMTWIESILAPYGVSADQVGLVAAAMILAGIVGSAIIPGLSDRFHRRKPLLLLCIAVGILALYPLCSSSGMTVLAVFGCVFGFFLFPGYALALTMTEDLSGPERAGAATGLLMLMGNLGGVVVILIMEVVKGDSLTWQPAVFLMIGLMVLALVLAILVGETFPKARKSDQAPSPEPIPK